MRVRTRSPLARWADAVALLAAVSVAGIAAESERVQVAAFYFPNWHRRTNDGAIVFGEWANLQRAVPRFPGHAQPKRPLWGIEDEADPSVMAKKIAAASAHGVDAFLFCWYYVPGGPRYHFALDHGFLRATNCGAVKFALMWANHRSVSREVFDRMTSLVVTQYFRHPAYWRLDGRCVFSIYEVRRFVNDMGSVEAARAALDTLRAAAEPAGGLHLNLVDFHLLKEKSPLELAQALGADSITSYVWIHCPAVWKVLQFPTTTYARARTAYFDHWKATWLHSARVPHWPNVTMGWDPSPRVPPDQPWGGGPYPRSPVLVDNSPAEFELALRQARTLAQTWPPGHRIVTIYAWNEWTEGGYLEPEEGTGYAYLEAIRRVFGERHEDR